MPRDFCFIPCNNMQLNNNKNYEANDTFKNCPRFVHYLLYAFLFCIHLQPILLVRQTVHFSIKLYILGFRVLSY
jgi:hypothetical protein